MNKIMYRCKKCKDPRVQQKEWVDMNTGETQGLLGGHEEDVWCPTCEEVLNMQKDIEEIEE